MALNKYRRLLVLTDCVRMQFASSTILSQNSRTFHRAPRLLARPKIGDTASITRTFSENDVLQFAALSGDTNSLHTGDKPSHTGEKPSHTGETPSHIGDKPSPGRTSGGKNPAQLGEFTNDKPSQLGEYERPIAHGILTLGVLSAVMGTKLPGEGSVIHHLDVTFPAPLFIGEEFTASVEVKQLRKRFVTLSLLCKVESVNKIVVKGTARLFLPRSE